MEKKISVILPVFNRETVVADAIQSIIDQTYKYWELIIIDDGSTDTSGDICDKYAMQDSRISVIHTSNHGVSHARNVGLEKASGEWVAFIDSDDLYLPTAFEKMIEYSDDVELVIANAIEMPTSKVYGAKLIDTRTINPHSMDYNFLYENRLVLTIWSRIYKRENITIKFDETLRTCEDVLFNIEFFANVKKIQFIPIISYIYRRISGNSLIGRFDNMNLIFLDKIYQRQHAAFHSEFTDQAYQKIFAVAAIDFIFNIVFMKKLSNTEKSLVILTNLEYPISRYRGLVRLETLTPFQAYFWNILLSNDIEAIMKEFQNYEKKSLELGGDKISIKNLILPLDPIDLENTFNINIAGIIVKICHHYDLIREKCRDYITSDALSPNVSVSSTAERIAYSKLWCLRHDGIEISDEYAEYDAVPYNLYGQLPQFGAFWLHSVVVEKDGEAYAFTAVPGVGKSTHGQLWLKAFPDAKIINGDNPIVRLQDDGRFYAYGTPFCGKEGYNVNIGVPLKAICFLQRAEENSIAPMDPEFALSNLCMDNYCITADSLDAHLELYRKLVNAVPCYKLSCNMDLEAACVAYSGMRGGKERIGNE